jgi:hypothetical protein
MCSTGTIRLAEEFRWALIKRLEAIAGKTHDMPVKTELLKMTTELRDGQ